MKLNGLDLNKLNVFCAVVEEKGYQGASFRIGLTRSAISQSITALEGQLGKKLFQRTGIRLIPTEAANRFYTEVKAYQTGIGHALDRFQDRSESESGLLRIGAYQEFARRKLMPALDSFLSAQPRAQVQFYFDSPTRLESLLENDRIDLSISIYPHSHQGVESKKIYEEELCLVGKKDRRLIGRDLTEIAKLPIIDYYPTHILFKRWWSVHSKKASPQLNIRSYAATAEMVLEMVERGMGIGVVPKYLLQNRVRHLQIFTPTSKKLVDHLWLNQKKEHRARKMDQLFISELKRLN